MIMRRTQQTVHSSFSEGNVLVLLVNLFCVRVCVCGLVNPTLPWLTHCPYPQSLSLCGIFLFIYLFIFFGFGGKQLLNHNK